MTDDSHRNKLPHMQTHENPANADGSPATNQSDNKSSSLFHTPERPKRHQPDYFEILLNEAKQGRSGRPYPAPIPRRPANCDPSILAAMPTVEVYIMRHGERLDKVKRFKLQRRAQPEPLDPPLTLRGYQQAAAAWRTLLAVLTTDRSYPGGRTIGVYASPLRRAAATALMVAAATARLAADGMSALVRENFLPAMPDHASSIIISVTIWNGLCGCAAMVSFLGGAQKVIAHQLIPTVSPLNDGTWNSPFGCEVQEWLDEASTAKVWFSGAKRSVQFVNQANVAVSPLIPALDGKDQSVQISCSNNNDNGMDHDEDGFEASLDRAIAHAHARGCDTIVLVAHREAMYRLYERWGDGGGKVNFNASYCCLASYRVHVDVSTRQHVWRPHRVVPYEQFDELCVPPA